MKRYTVVIFVMLCVLCFAVPVYAGEAALLNKDAKFTASFGNSASVTDGNRGTKAVIVGDAEIKIETLVSSHSLYLVWDKYPVTWTLASGEQIIAQSDDTKRLHEYVDFFSADTNTAPIADMSSLTNLTLRITDGILCDISLFGEGDKHPDFVQKWNSPYEDADILLVPTHADDEHLFFGGAMPYYSQDKKVQVAYFTVHTDEIYRQHELLNGLYKVGMTAYPVFSDFTDYLAYSIEQSKKLYDEDDAVAYMVTLLRRFKPEVVIDHDINGEYGHGVHMYNTYCLQKALPLAADTNYFDNTYEAHKVLKTYLHLYAENPIIMDWDTPLEHFDGKTALEMAVEGFATHKSQQNYFSVEASGQYDCRKFGLYDTGVGLDISKNDFFENITEDMYSDYVAPPPPPAPVITPVESEPPAQITPPTDNKLNIIIYIIPIAIILFVIGIVIVTKTRKK